MRILLLSRKASLYSTRRLRLAARAMGHDLRVVDPLTCVLHLAGGKPSVSRHGRVLKRPDVLIPRVGTYGMSYALAVVRQFELMGVPTVNGHDAIARAKDKLGALQLLARRGFPIPDTIVTHFPHDLDRLIEDLGGAPLILKLPRGSQGTGVIKADSREAAESVLDTLWSLGQDILLQRFISEAQGKDLRVFVIGGRAAAAMRRCAKAGEFRSNIHRGGAGEKVALTRPMAELALDATRCLGLDLAGVDILESHRGPLILEVNPSPGFEGLESATGQDIAGQILEYAVSVSSSRTRKPRTASAH